MRIVWLLLAPTVGCSSISAAGGWTHHDQIVSSRFSQGATGSGLAVEVGGSRTTSGGAIGAFALFDYIDQGYAGVRWFGASVRYRRYLLGSGPVAGYVAFGGGAGGSVGGVKVEAHAELGARLGLGAGTALTLGIRERPAVHVTERNTSGFNLMNTLEVAIGLELQVDGPTGPKRVARRPPTRARARPVPRPRRCSDSVSWYLEPSLWFGAGNAHHRDEAEHEAAVRNTAGVILSPCENVSFRLGLSLSRYTGTRDELESLRFEDSPIGFWGFGPEVEADLLRIGNWRFGLGMALEIGDRDENPRPGEGHPVILRWSARARWRGATFGFDMLHSSGEGYRCCFDSLHPEIAPGDQPGTAVMFGVGISGKPPWVGLITELVLYVILASKYQRD